MLSTDEKQWLLKLARDTKRMIARGIWDQVTIQIKKDKA